MVGFNIEELVDSIGVELDPQQFKINVKEYLRNRPGFFSPFKSGIDFAETLARPVQIPLAGGVIIGLIAAAPAIAAVVCVCGLITAGILAIAKNTDARNTALTVAAAAGLLALIGPLIAILAAIVVVLALAAATVELGTRTVATVVNFFGTIFDSCCPVADNEEDEIDSEDELAPELFPTSP